MGGGYTGVQCKMTSYLFEFFIVNYLEKYTMNRNGKL